MMPLLVPAGTLQTYFPFIVGKALYGRALIEVIFGVWLILIYKYPEYRPRRSYVILAFAIYVFVAVLAGAAGVSWHRSLWSTYERMQGIVDLAHWLAFVVVVGSVFRSWLHWRDLLNFSLAVSGVVAILGLAQYFDASVPVYRFLHGTARLDITLGNATFVGAFMLVNVLIALGFLAQSFVADAPAQARSTGRRRRRGRSRESQQISEVAYLRAFWIVVVGLDFTILWLSGTRGALLGLFAGLATAAAGYALFGKLHFMRRTALSVLGVLIALAVLYGVTAGTGVLEKIGSSSLTLRRIASVGPEDLSIKGRLTSLNAGLQGFADRPLLGWGPENYGIAWARHFDAESGVSETFDQAHNKPVEELTTKGILGFLSYGAVWVVMAIIVIRRLREHDPPQQALTLFLGAALVAYFVQNLFLFDTPATGLQFYLLMGYVVYLEVGTAESELEPSGRRRRTDKDEGPPFWQRSLPTYGLVVVLVLAIAGASFGILANYRTFKAAQSAARTFSGSISWENRFEYFRESIDGFQPLANYPRRAFFDQLAENWDTLTEEQASTALGMVEVEAGNMFRAEPQTWLGAVKLTNVYLAVSASNPEYLPTAKFYLDQARLVAPKTLEVSLLEQEFKRLETSLGAAAEEGGSP